MTSIASSVPHRPLPSTILLVEDDPDSLEMYAVALRHGGLFVTTARNGAEALERAFEIIPDLVVTDVVMPVVDGLTLCDRLRADPRTHDTPIIAVTARPVSGAERDRLTRDDHVSLLSKPCEPEKLLLEIRRLLETSRMLRERSLQMPQPAESLLARAAPIPRSDEGHRGA